MSVTFSAHLANGRPVHGPFVNLCNVNAAKLWRTLQGPGEWFCGEADLQVLEMLTAPLATEIERLGSHHGDPVDVVRSRGAMGARVIEHHVTAAGMADRILRFRDFLKTARALGAERVSWG